MLFRSDYLTIQAATLPELKVDKTLSDSKSTESTQRLMSYLVDTYGNNIISGQQELYGQAGETEFEYIYNLSGEYPAIRGFDYMNWSQGVNWNDGTNDRIINWVNTRGGIATVAWHWFVPMDMDTYNPNNISWDNVSFYCNGAGNGKDTTFSPKQALIKGTPENEFIMKDIDMIATALLELQEADVPIIFRPLHEAEGSSSIDGSGCWFWWASDGAEVYKELWKLLYDTITNEYGLHNLIWEWNSYTYETSKAWYPGDDYVDIVAYDKYNATDWSTNTTKPNESAISGTFYSLVEMYEGKKMVAMAENDTIPNVENLTSEKAGWLYFCPWYGEHLMDSKFNDPATLTAIYKSDYVITLDELPNLKEYPLDGGVTPPVTTPVETTTTEEETSTSEVETDVITSESETNLTVTQETTTETTTEDITTSEDVSDTTTAGDTVVPPSVLPTLLGDVTCDGVIDIRDITLLNQYIVKLKPLSEQGLANGDIFKDGIVEIKDLGLLKQYIVKLIDSFE